MQLTDGFFLREGEEFLVVHTSDVIIPIHNNFFKGFRLDESIANSGLP